MNTSTLRLSLTSGCAALLLVAVGFVALPTTGAVAAPAAAAKKKRPARRAPRRVDTGEGDHGPSGANVEFRSGAKVSDE